MSELRTCSACLHRLAHPTEEPCSSCLTTPHDNWEPSVGLLAECKLAAQRAREVNGDEYQDRKILEEIGEYMTAHLQRKDGRDTHEHEQEEAADVILAMLGKLDAVGWKILGEKRKRLLKRLAEKQAKE